MSLDSHMKFVFVTAAWTILSRLGNNFLSGSSVLAKLIMESNFTLTISPQLYQHSNHEPSIHVAILLTTVCIGLVFCNFLYVAMIYFNLCIICVYVENKYFFKSKKSQ